MVRKNEKQYFNISALILCAGREVVLSIAKQCDLAIDKKGCANGLRKYKNNDDNNEGMHSTNKSSGLKDKTLIDIFFQPHAKR